MNVTLFIYKWIEKYRKLKTKYQELKKKKFDSDTSIEGANTILMQK